MTDAARLTGPAERLLELEPLRYWFPGADTPWDYTANWLMIRLTAADGRYHWTVEQPMLLTWELHELILWLRAVADAVPHCADDFEGMEPQLGFKRQGLGDAAQVTAHFNYGVRPPELEESDCFEPFIIEFTPGVAGLRRFADGLERFRHLLPVRVVQQDGIAQRWIHAHGR